MLEFKLHGIIGNQTLEKRKFNKKKILPSACVRAGIATKKKKKKKNEENILREY